MARASPPAAAAPLPRPVSTTDLWKTAALLFMFVDHYGFYFDPADPWWRVFGRVAAPIFFFLVGFARSRTVPWTWIAFGTILSALHAWGSASAWDPMLNILFNFALIRLARPWIEAGILPHPARLAAFAAACAVLAPVLNPVLEYGSGGWLWALFGLLQRETLARGGASATARTTLAALAASAYVAVQTAHFGFGWWPTVAVAVLIAGLALLLARFRRTEAAFQPPRPASDALAFLGRHTLEIYALHLIALELVIHVLP